MSQGFRNKTASLHFCRLFEQIWDLYLGEVCLDVALLCWQGVSYCGLARLWCHVKHSEKWIPSSSAWHERLMFQHYDIICYCVFSVKFNGDKMMDSWPLANARFASLFCSHSRSLICLLIFTHILSYLFTYSLIHSLTQSYAHLLSCSLSLIHFLNHSLTYIITKQLAYSLHHLLVSCQLFT